MESSFVFETGATLCVQISFVVLLTVASERWLDEAKSGCRLWTICFVSILGLIAAALLLPHRRLFAFPTSFSRETLLGIVTWQSWLVAGLASVWTLGVAFSLLHRGVRCLQLIRFLNHHCDVLTAEQIARLPLDLEGRDRQLIDGDRRLKALRLMSSDEIQGPFCWQLHRPVIVLPGYLIDKDEATLRHILVHELEHLRTKHPMQHFLQGACSTLFWFHPAVWLAAHDAELTREYHCDEVAAVAGGNLAAYLRTLAKIAERCSRISCTDGPAGTLAFGNREGALVRRSNRLVKLARQPHKSSRFRSALAFAGLVLFTPLVNQLWLPTNAMTSLRSDWSPWPTWTAKALHTVDISVRDFEPFDERIQMRELLEDDD